MLSMSGCYHISLGYLVTVCCQSVGYGVSCGGHRMVAGRCSAVLWSGVERVGWGLKAPSGWLPAVSLYQDLPPTQMYKLKIKLRIAILRVKEGVWCK